jgi:exosortase
MLTRQFPMRFVAIVVFFAALWLILWRQLSGEWSVNDQYSYGWFVPFFAALLFWLRWEDAPKAREASGQRPAVSDQGTNNKEPITNNSKARAIAIGIAIVALLLLFPIRVFEIANPDWRPLNWLHAFCVVTITLAFLWWIGGTSWLRHFAFPVLFTLIAVPWVSPIEEPIVQGLMRVVAAISSEAVALFGIPAQLEGSLIRIPNGLVGVNEACSGVRSLQTSLMIGLLFGELKRLSIFRRVVLVLSAAAIAFFGNCARSFFLVWIAATRNVATANSWHDLAGYGIVAAVFIGSLVAATLLGRRQNTEVGGQKTEIRGQKSEDTNNKEPINNNPAATDFVVARTALVVAAVWLVAVEIAAAGWYRTHESALVASARWEVKWPQTAPNFHDVHIDEQVRGILRFDSGQAATWRLPALDSNNDASSLTRPLSCTVYFFRWKPGKNSALLTNVHRPDVCLPAVGWSQTGDSGVTNYPVTSNLALPFRHFEFRHGTNNQPTQEIAHAFYCLWEDRVPSSSATSQLPQMASAPSDWSRDERVRAVLEGRRHLGQQVMELIIQGRDPLDIDQVNAKFAALIPTLIQVDD